MHIKIAYYSGSGNTQYVALLLKRYLSSHHRVSTFFIKKRKKVEDDFDALIIGTPVYAYKPPNTVLDFIEGLSGYKRPAFVFVTKGLISGDAGRIVALKLKEMGFVVGGVKDVLMADSLFILLAKEGSLLHTLMLFPNRGIKHRVKNLAFFIEKEIESGKEHIPKSKVYVPFTSLVASLFWKKEKKWESEFFADERCDLCGACVGLCPTGNILIEENKVLWDNTCDFCIRCLHRCPQKAIQIGKYTRKSPRYRGPLS